MEKKFKKGVDKEWRTRYNNRAVRESGKRGHWKLNNEDKYKAQSARKVGQRIWEKGFVWEREDEWLSQGWLGAGDTESSETSKEEASEKQSSELLRFKASWVMFWIQWFREFDPGSGWTLAARLTHASRTVKAPSGAYKVANGWLTRGQPAS